MIYIFKTHLFISPLQAGANNWKFQVIGGAFSYK